jgi:hypothetical protein
LGNFAARVRMARKTSAATRIRTHHLQQQHILWVPQWAQVRSRQSAKWLWPSWWHYISSKQRNETKTNNFKTNQAKQQTSESHPTIFSRSTVVKPMSEFPFRPLIVGINFQGRQKTLKIARTLAN